MTKKLTDKQAALSPWLKAQEAKAKLYGLFDAMNEPDKDNALPDVIEVKVVDARNPDRNPITRELTH